MKKTLGVLLSMIYLFAVPLLFGDVELTVTSEPAGATVTSGGQTYGTTPVMIRVPTRGKKQPCFIAAALRLTWASGAYATTPADFTICESSGRKQAMSFPRPPEVAGADLDYQYAVQLAQLDLMRRQMLLNAYLGIEQQRQEQYEAQQHNMLEYVRSLQDFGKRPQPALSCTSERIGNVVYTRCQ